MTRHGVRMAYSGSMPKPESAHLLRRVACILTRNTAVATLGYRTTAPLPAAPILGCAATAKDAPLVVGMTVEGV